MYLGSAGRSDSMFKTYDHWRPISQSIATLLRSAPLCVLCHNVIWICFPIVLGRAINELNRHLTTQTLLELLPAC